MKYLFNYLFIITLLCIGCSKDIDELIIEKETDEPIVLIKSSIRGIVTNEAGAFVSDALITINGQNQFSDERGQFNFINATVNKAGSIIAARSDDFFTGITHSNFSPEGKSFVSIKMLNKETPEIVASLTGATFTNTQGVKIDIPAGSITTQNGSVYDGPVSVYSRWIDPTDSEVGGLMPGALNASDETGNSLVLATYGMVALELETSNGEKLSVKDGEFIDIEMPIPAALQEAAPDEIPLWRYDTEQEEWLLEGVCQKSGGKYLCKITSGGYWNCDVPLEAICLSGKFLHADSTFAAYHKVIVEDLTDNFIYWGFTDSLGYFCGSVPQGAPLLLTVKDQCDSVLYEMEVGPYADDFFIDTVYLDGTSALFNINLTGSVQHCVTTDIPDGHLAVRYPGYIFIIPFETGGFNLNLELRCATFPEMEIRAYSNSQPQTTPAIFHDEFTNLALGNQLTCENLPDYFNLSIEDLDYWAAPTQYTYKNNQTTNWLVLEGLSGKGKFQIDIRDYTGVGTYNSSIFFKTKNSGLQSPPYPVLDISSPNLSVEITEDDGVYITGTYIGTRINADNSQTEFNGDFKVRKAP